MAFDDWIMEGDSDSPAIGWFTSNGSDSWLSSLMPYAFSALIRNLYLVVSKECECKITRKKNRGKVLDSPGAGNEVLNGHLTLLGRLCLQPHVPDVPAIVLLQLASLTKHLTLHSNST